MADWNIYLLGALLIVSGSLCVEVFLLWRNYRRLFKKVNNETQT